MFVIRRGTLLFLPLLQRAGRSLLVIAGVVVANFFLLRLAPGDPALAIAGDAGAGDPAYLASLRASLGLDHPLWQQFLIYVHGALKLDFGYSYRNHAPVLSLVLTRLPATLLLMVSAFLLSLIFGVFFGLLAGYGHHRGRSRTSNAVQRRQAGRFRVLDAVIRAVSLLLYATPIFWLSLVLTIVFSVWLDWLPSFGMETVGAMAQGGSRAVDVITHLALPAISLSVVYSAIYAQLTRAAVLEVIDQDFVKTARAKGASEPRVLLGHVLRNALLPVVSFSGVQLAELAGGALITEAVFSWPGIGGLMFDALLQRDYPVLLGVLLAISTLVVLVNIVTDMLYRVVDPRVERGARA
jgi:peptide/nickel transport system permease protein